MLIVCSLAAADQLHMIYSYSSLFRQWNEAIPGPRSYISLILLCREIEERIEELKGAAEKE